MKDPAFAPLLPQWQDAFPGNMTVPMDEVGHNVDEEAGPHLIEPIGRFLKGEMLQ